MEDSPKFLVSTRIWGRFTACKVPKTLGMCIDALSNRFDFFDDVMLPFYQG